MYTKTISVNTNWLDAIDGKTVADAIAYLQTLNSEYILTYFLEGDTHGCTVESFIEKQVPMANKEILEKLERQYTNSIANHKKSIRYFTDKGQLDRLPAVEKLIADIEAKREDARRKYGEGL